MKHLTDAVRQAVRQENWYAALGMSLALPDICAQLEAPSRKSRAPYIAWCARYLVPTYTTELPDIERVWLTAGDCYALRCAFLHSGREDITDQSARIALSAFAFIEPSPLMDMHRNDFHGQLQLRVDRFCEDICSGVDTWTNDVLCSADVQRRIGEMLEIRDISKGMSLSGVSIRFVAAPPDEAESR